MQVDCLSCRKYHVERQSHAGMDRSFPIRPFHQNTVRLFVCEIVFSSRNFLLPWNIPVHDDQKSVKILDGSLACAHINETWWFWLASTEPSNIIGRRTDRPIASRSKTLSDSAGVASHEYPRPAGIHLCGRMTLKIVVTSPLISRMLERVVEEAF